MMCAQERLHSAILAGNPEAELAALWDCVTESAGREFYTASGLPFSYELKLGKHGSPTAELLITRKGESKTLTRSSVVYAYGVVRRAMTVEDGTIRLPCCKGPKAIGQIFGISYVYSLFWNWQLISVPEAMEVKLRHT